MDLKQAVEKDDSDADAAKYGFDYEQKFLKKLAPEETAGYVLAENPSFTLIRQDLARLTSLLIAAKEEYQPGRPEITTLESQIEADQKSLHETAQHIVTTTTKARNPLINDALSKIADNEASWVVGSEVLRLAKADEAAAEKQLGRLPDRVARYEILKAELDELEKTYEGLDEKRYELEVTENSGVANAIVASKAQVPGAPSGPNRALNIFGGLIAGLVAGLAAAVILDQFDTRVREPGAVERILNLPSLSAVPIVQADDGKAPLIGRVSQNHAFIEAFRLLRNNIYFSMPDVRSLISFENQKSHAPIIAITSATKGDGKSTIASNLAVASGLDGKRTLLIDVDLRRPAVHRVFATDRQDGLTNLVIGTSTRSEVIKQSDFPNLSILVAGPLPPLANEFLNSEACRQTLLDLAEDYDLVVLDCPPCTGLSDFQIISSVATAAVMVASLDYTRKPFLKAARQALNRSACPVLGIVLNGLSNRWSPYRNQYYYYYSYYGEDEDKDKAKRKSKVRSSTQ
jgi:capsular exopolysaccharide synthesis family protein